jgi:hypothetical protein
MRHNEYIDTFPDFVRLVLLSDQLNDGQVNLRDVELNRNGADMFFDEIERTVQSHETLLLDKHLRLYVCGVKLLHK